MNELNPNDFLFGEIPRKGKKMSIEYSSSAKMKEDQKSRVFKLSSYRYEFSKLFSDGKYVDYGMQDYYSSTRHSLSNVDFNSHNNFLSFKFNCFLYHDKDETMKELEKFKNFVISTMKDLKKEAAGEAMVNGIIRDSKGRDITEKAFKIMEKALIAASGRIYNKPNREIVEDVVEGSRTSEQKLKARDDLSRHRKNAEILERRVQMGTFPYDENGDWKLV